MKEFLNYQYMITPGVLKILSYVGMVVALVVGLFTLTQDVVAGISLTVLGPIAVRLYTELMLVIFEIHKELKQMNGKR
jgi:hypothetical protein